MKLTRNQVFITELAKFVMDLAKRGVPIHYNGLHYQLCRDEKLGSTVYIFGNALATWLHEASPVQDMIGMQEAFKAFAERFDPTVNEIPYNFHQSASLASVYWTIVIAHYFTSRDELSDAGLEAAHALQAYAAELMEEMESEHGSLAVADQYRVTLESQSGRNALVFIWQELLRDQPETAPRIVTPVKASSRLH